MLRLHNPIKQLQNITIRYYSSTTLDSEVLFETKGKCLNVTLNRPKALNSLNSNMVKILTPKYLEMKKSLKDGDMVVVMKGAGDKSFCAGGDIRAIYDIGKQTDQNTPKESDGDFFREEYMLNQLIGTNTIPQVSIYNGFAMGGGIGVSIHGKFRVATENTVFAMPETGIGFFCDVGGSYFLSRLPNHMGMYLALTGAKLKGKNVRVTGVATHYVPNAQVPQLQQELETLSNPTEANVKAVLDKFSENVDINDKSLDVVQHLETIKRCFSKSSVEDIIASLEKEGTDWSKQTVNTLKSVSPTSLKVVYEQLQRGKSLSLDECLKMEYRMSQVFVRNNDFFEGVRALLVDKDKNPKWTPPTLSEVSNNTVQSYFQPLNAKKELKFF
ncbi:3-hydroxyisobutyryl-Coenzyme A hydrolase [Tieghemostelium lacteum]|uniref:3-hydroxyisobutyryl-CoA hydrolase n=1 Tax=Tieghemostelium lacteum TaxID=361077 RepID=A0A152A819_TIELA|nr:3-hydroxyisobutyryl-Coenzyme A hydrolase [Tieghemostelium lacteum]|eukprot:KYR02382.1 3-hydroxyisobutyryl-Coenzyme A hydrolase [Tieghemostelium lacteum]